MNVFELLADAVERAWSERENDTRAFADVAASALAASGVAEQLDAESALRWVQSADLPEQDDETGNGEPAITVVRRDGFRVELAFWRSLGTEVHEHRAEGAFVCLGGERLHLLYAFDEAGPGGGASAAAVFAADDSSPDARRAARRAVDDELGGLGLSLGELSLRSVAVLRRGDIQRVYPGRRSLHALFFAVGPAATLTVRALGGGEDAQPLRHYPNRHVALDSSVSRLTIARRLEAAEVFVGLFPQEHFGRAQRLIDEEDIHTVHSVLGALENTIPASAFESLLDRARDRFGRWLVKIQRAQRRQQRRDAAVELLIGRLRGRAERLLLGLIWADASPEQVAALFVSELPGEAPRDVLASCEAAAAGNAEAGRVLSRFRRSLEAA